MTNQASEDELRAEILTEFKQVHKLAPADYTENCTNVVMSIIRTEKLKLLAEVTKKPSTLPQGSQHIESVKQGINFYHKKMMKRIAKLEAEL